VLLIDSFLGRQKFCNGRENDILLVNCSTMELARFAENRDAPIEEGAISAIAEKCPGAVL
jgi:hypothetical protein